MSLRFIYGRAGSGKSSFCIKDIKKRIEENVNYPLIYLVPEQFSFQSEKNIITEIGERANLNVKVLNFKRMAFRVMNEVGGITNKRMNSSGKCMLINYILKEATSSLTVFRGAASEKGFVNTISDSISEFKRYNVTPEKLFKIAGDLEDNTNLKNKLLDMAFIYQRFEKLIEESYIDADDDLTILKDSLDNCNLYDNAEIWIDEFSSFTPQQLKVIEKLLKKARTINITLVGEKEDEVKEEIFRFTKATENKLLRLAIDNNVSLEKAVDLNKRPFYRFSSSSELQFLEKNLYCFPYERYEKETSNVKLFRAQNSYSEIENTAREIIEMVRDKGLRFKDIAVVTRDLKSYENIISALFKEYDIPYFIDEKKEIESNLLVVLINSVIEILTKNWSYEAVFKYLKTGLIDIDRDDVDILENYVLATGIKGRNKWLSKNHWNYRVNSFFGDSEITSEEMELLNKVNSIRNYVREPLIKLYNKVKDKKEGEKFCKAVFEFLEDIALQNKVEKVVDEFKNTGNQNLANEYSHIWNVIMDLLDQTVEIMGSESLDLEQFLEILQIGFREQKMGLIPPSIDQVLVGSIERVKSHDVSHLYILGVNDSVFPAVNNDEGILNDLEREILKNKGMELAKDTREAAFEEQFLVYTTLTIPCNYLKISYPMADFEGKSLRPSIIVSRIKTIFPNIIEENDLMLEETDETIMNLISTKTPTFNELIAVLRKRLDGIDDSLIWRDVYKWFSSNEEWKVKCQKAFSGAVYSNQVKAIKKEKVKKLYEYNSKMNVSRLERYVECPFSYYVQYGLKAKDRKIFKLSYPDIGTFLHKIIDEFSNKVKEDKLSWDELSPNWCENAIEAIVESNINSEGSYILKSSARYEYLTGRLKKVLTKTALVITNHIKTSGFKPIGYEIDFGNVDGYPPIVVELSSGEKINLIGRIDRIDMLIKDSNTYIRIIDYKSGNKIFKLSEVYYGLQVQLLLYLDAILSQNKDNLPAAVLYFKIDNPLIKTNNDLTDEALEEEIMKKFKMKGLLIDDVEIIKEMDKEMDGNSYIIPARINKDGTLGKSDAASIYQFELLRKHVKKIIAENCEKLISGDISISPCKNGDSIPCEYCSYSSICTFEEELLDNSYRQIYEKSDDEVWQLLNKEYGHDLVGEK